MKNKIEKLKEKVLKIATQADLMDSSIKGVRFFRRNKPTPPQCCFYKPMAILVLQGKKQTNLGTESFTYTTGQCVIAGIDIPSAGKIIEASPDKPFLTLIIELDSRLIAELLPDIPTAENLLVSKRGMGIMKANDNLLDAFERLLNIEQSPEKHKIMVPMILKEIHYLLLTSPLGNLLRTVYTKGTQSNQIAKAVIWLREHYKQPLKIPELAKQVNMTESTFYRHFLKVTSLSPLQYQKRLRLYEAQHLMLTENKDAGTAGYLVGYKNEAQFNREYKRMFGLPPKSHISQIKNTHKESSY